MWPHRLTVKRSLEIALIFSFFAGIALLFAAYLDHTLVLDGANVGLLQHSGMVSILSGDVALFVLSCYCARLTRKIGVKLPNREPHLLRRYYRTKVQRRMHRGQSIFLRAFGIFSLVGAMALVNQSIKLTDPIYYYGHDTFDSIAHPYSFAANRMNLFISWCIVIPLFAGYLVNYLTALNQTVSIADKKDLLLFNLNHPDKSGGFAFFGFLNTMFMVGLLIILLEAFLLSYTHAQIDTSNIAAMVSVGGAFLLISHYSIYRVQKAIRRLEFRLKSRDSIRRSRDRRDLDTHFFAILYEVRFTAYRGIVAKSMFGLRIASLVPALIRVYQYSSQSTN